MRNRLMIVGSDSGGLYVLRRFAELNGFSTCVPGNKETDAPNLDNVAVLVVDADDEEATATRSMDRLRAACNAHDVPVVLCSWHHPTRIDTETYHLQKPVLYRDFVAVLEASGACPR